MVVLMWWLDGKANPRFVSNHSEADVIKLGAGDILSYFEMLLSEVHVHG